MRKQKQQKIGKTTMKTKRTTLPKTIHVVTGNSAGLNSTTDILDRYVASPRSTPEENARIREISGSQCIVQMFAVDNAIKPYPVQYFQQVAINALDQAWEAGLQTLEERDAAVMTALAESEIEYGKLLRRALKVARRELPMALVPAMEQAALIAEAVCTAIEERYLPYVFADGGIRKFHDILWPAIKRTLAEKLYVDCEPIDERRFMKWLLLPNPNKPSKATARSK